MDQLRHLLIVEDEAIIAMSFEMALSNDGYDCRVVATGEEALAALDSQVPDAVVMDIHLAGDLDGIECAKKIRLAHQMPIIFITGYNAQEVRQRGKDLERVYYMEKPMTVQDLLRRLHQVMQIEPNTGSEINK